MSLDHDEPDILDEAACRSLLASTRVGRIAVTDRALPLILPVAFACRGADIVVQLVPGAVDRAADAGQVVCFQADWTEEADGSGWSVEAIGHLRRVDDPDEVDAYRSLRSWAHTEGPFAVLHPEVLTGRLR